MTITSKELKTKMSGSEDLYIIDVREPYEYDDFRISETLLPLGDIMDNLAVLEEQKERHIVLYCNTGKRSIVVADLLSSLGFPHVSYLQGGLEAWKEETD